MAAGLGFKTFNTGDVLTAADTNGYLMQGVWVFANATARTAAVTSPQEGNMSYLSDTNSVEYYSGSAWVAVGGSSDFVKISAATYTNQTSINIDNIFSSTYKSYYINIESAFCVTTGSALQMKWRYGGVTAGNTHYGVLRGYDYAGGTYTTNNLAAAFHTLNQNPGTLTPGSRTIINVTGANGSSARPVFFGNSTSFNSGELDIVMGWAETPQTYDGINLSVASGNITATVQVYGRKA